MSEILLKQNISIRQNAEVVLFAVANMIVPMHYPVGFKIAQGLRLAAKAAMQVNGESLSDWRDMAELDESSLTNDPSTYLRPMKFGWSASSKGDRVKFDFGSESLEMHYKDALQLASWLNLKSKQAKEWVGDTSQGIIMSGTLTAKAD